MAGPPEISSMALFCDFENIALGVRDAKYTSFDIRLVLERLLLKGSIVVKKSYCDWDRYKEFKKTMHEAAFELIEIPHVRQSGKNSADIRMVVDALDLCYTKSHVDAFVIISGDSDFSPLVSKLRENNKYVIGIGVRDSTSDLLAANCDEFIYYDDLIRETEKKKPRARKSTAKPLAPVAAAVVEAVSEARSTPTPKPKPKPPAQASETKSARGRGRGSRARPREENPPDEAGIDGSHGPVDRHVGNHDDDTDEDLAKRQEAIDFLVETIEALASERGDDEKLWGSMVKQTMKRRRPGFNESSCGYRSFRELVDDAQSRHLLIVVKDERPGQYALRVPPPPD